MKISLLLVPILFIVSCATTQSFREVHESEVPKYTDAISKNEIGSYSSYWVQPGNIKQKCEILMEGYDFIKKSGDELKSESLIWDGGCKNGKTHGLGKMLVTQGSIDWYEIAYHNQGVTDEYFYKTVVGSKNAKFGAYIRENDKMTKLLTNAASLNNDGSIDQIYLNIEQDLKFNISTGMFVKNYSDGFARFSGKLGSHLFFGKREVYNKSNELNFSNYGYYDLEADKPKLAFIHQDKSRTQHIKIKDDTTNEFVQLPLTFVKEVQRVPEDALKIARTASRAGELALIMKEKYEKNHGISANDESQRESPKLERTVSTGTGFFVSNDGVLLTNSHVVKDSSKTYVFFENRKIEAIVIAQDPINDIALLKIDNITTAIPLEVEKNIKKGSEISILGYPNIGLQGNEQKATFGYINSNSGLLGDLRYYQMSAPIQAGNSGSPVLNNSGSVVGIATSTLNQNAALKSTGNLAQNVNYAIKITYALPLLISNKVRYSKPNSSEPINKINLIDKIGHSVVLVLAE